MQKKHNKTLCLWLSWKSFEKKLYTKNFFPHWNLRAIIFFHNFFFQSSSSLSYNIQHDHFEGLKLKVFIFLNHAIIELIDLKFIQNFMLFKPLQHPENVSNYKSRHSFHLLNIHLSLLKIVNETRKGIFNVNSLNIFLVCFKKYIFQEILLSIN